MIQPENYVINRVESDEMKKDENRFVDLNHELQAEQKDVISQAVRLIQTNEICPIFQISSMTG